MTTTLTPQQMRQIARGIMSLPGLTAQDRRRLDCILEVIDEQEAQR